MARIHKDVEFAVESEGSSSTSRYFDDPKEAAHHLVSLCISRGEAVLDVLISSRAGARAYGGDDAVEQYDEDPDASIFERFEFRCNSAGRVP